MILPMCLINGATKLKEAFYSGLRPAGHIPALKGPGTRGNYTAWAQSRGFFGGGPRVMRKANSYRLKEN